MTDADPTTLYCSNHPQTPTNLRCNRCEKPICPKCAIATPTGYRCKECVRGQQKTFETAQWYDFPLSFAVVAILSFLGSLLASALGFWTIFIAPVAGLVISEAARFVVRRRRSRILFISATIAAVVGGLPLLLWGLAYFIVGLSQGSFNINIIFQLLWPGIYIVIIASTVYYRLSGINIR